FWPGVPNRYSTRSSARVIRPKSIATVVVDLAGVCARSSTPTDSLVTRASVRSGTISETEPTKVVLPTPNPPAMTIFVDAAARLPLESTESTEGPFKEVEAFVVRGLLGQGRLDVDVALLDEVAQQHAYDAEGRLDQGRDLGHGAGVADPHDPTLHVVAPRAACGRRVQAERRLQREVDSRTRAAGSQCVRSDDAGSRRAGVHLLGLRPVHHVVPPPTPRGRGPGPGPSDRPARRAGPSRSPPDRCRPWTRSAPRCASRRRRSSGAWSRS